MSDYNISGIQQIGIGVDDLNIACSWYAKHFGMDLPIFKDEAEASLMTQFTGNRIEKRKAILTMNLQGGGGFEIWQYTSRKPKAPLNLSEEGHLGISHVHLRAANIKMAHQYFTDLKDVYVGEINLNAMGKSWFHLQDPFDNKFKIVEDNYCFIPTKSVVGGVIGVSIGVSDMDRSLSIYQNALRYNEITAEEKKESFHRVFLQPTSTQSSAFGELLGPTYLELICHSEPNQPKIYKDRYWGDLGFIHICFDVQNMHALRDKMRSINYPFLVDSENSFIMGEAAGQFGYIQDDDETLIELVETHKVPIIKKIGWYIHLKNKKNQTPLPKIIFYILGISRIKK